MVEPSFISPTSLTPPIKPPAWPPPPLPLFATQRSTQTDKLWRIGACLVLAQCWSSSGIGQAVGLTNVPYNPTACLQLTQR